MTRLSENKSDKKTSKNKNKKKKLLIAQPRIEPEWTGE